MKKVFDEIYGYIDLDELEVNLIDSPIFQRLRRIKQTSLAYIVYPGATHTRFSHSLGTYYLAAKVGEKLYKENAISDEELLTLKISALLHDIGQFPFSHSIEGYYLNQGFGNKELREYILTKSMIRDILEDNGINVEKILDVYNGKSLLSSIINGEVDVDRIDYLMRDSRHTGVQLGKLDLDRLIDTIFYTKDGITILDKGIISLENFYISRLHMYQAVYYHKTILGYELFLRKIFEEVVDSCNNEFKDIKYIKELVDQNLISYWDDELIISSLYHCLTQNISISLAEKIKNFMDRKGPKVVYEEVMYKEEENYLKDLISQLQNSGIPNESIYPFEEKISILDKNKIKILSKGKEKKIKDYSATLLHEIPESIIIRRVYVDYEYAKKAREILS
ncbi:HD domain-containing protein [Acidianus sulfidivorans JP7]|uniref:Phosphohydrolase n=1 Tax=Acidianus sulfidivorans JP7 TaxID=619593 RepID=A0A2U9IM88_9CREN|nr:HD domain-containing protein [Acidianus sulfidivorans]AWR97105.1 HD domain-containing protein [Acidianus sulfidivorans JP7]